MNIGDLACITKITHQSFPLDPDRENKLIGRVGEITHLYRHGRVCKLKFPDGSTYAALSEEVRLEKKS